MPHDFILVLGMGRSGTSALTSVLTRMGYSVGTSLLEKAPSNLRCFWENRQLMNLESTLISTGILQDEFVFQVVSKKHP